LRRGTALASPPGVEATRNDEPDSELGPEQGGGPPAGMPWTLFVKDENWAADLEHAAPLPRVGDRIEYIAEDGSRRVFRVAEVVHTVQASAAHRPRVREERRGPNTLVNDDDRAGGPRELRAGLPRVVVTVEG
jgi:hypothetical protein